ncbi:MAG: XdhC family protein [Ferruginibacter sp.]
MHKQLPAWQLIQQSLQQNIAVMLLYVIESKGSSPGRQGFMMVVNADGDMIGSLGGGIMEHKFIELAKSKLVESLEEVSIHKQLHDKVSAKNQSGMICSGEQTIFLYSVYEGDIDSVVALIRSLENNENGTLQLSPQGITFSVDIPSTDFSLEVFSEEDFLYTEKTGHRNHLYIIGGGHCALAFSKLMSGMDFYIHLYDDREGLNTMQQNEYAHEKTMIEDYAELAHLIPSGNNIYVVIMTFGYRTDEVVLKALLGKEFKYFGLLGSNSKISKMFKDFVMAGTSPLLLNHIHAPVGLQIKSQTPEEIAVSIAAEIIQVKNQYNV